MNVYDSAHSLGKTLKDSNEYKEYLDMHNKVISNNKTKEMIGDFRKKAMELQMLQMSGKEIDKDKINQIKALEDVLMANPLISDYFKAEMRFSQMMNDVYKILSDHIDIDLGLDK